MGEPDPGRPESLADLRVAAVLALALAVLGALLGLVWQAWSGPQQRAYVIAPGKLYPFDEVETMAAADGRYLLIVGVTGLVAALLAWTARPGNRGPLVQLALAVGGFAGALLTAWVGPPRRGRHRGGQEPARRSRICSCRCTCADWCWWSRRSPR